MVSPSRQRPNPRVASSLARRPLPPTGSASTSGLPIAPLPPQLLPEDVPETRPAALLVAHVLPVVLALVQRGLHRERHLALVRVHVDDLHVQLVAFLHHVARVLHPLVAQLADVDQAFDAGLDLHEGAEVGDLGDLALHPAADGVLVGQLGPWIRVELLDAEREPLVLHVDVQHHRLHLVALLVQVAGVLDALGPGDVAHVHQAVDALLDADEDAEVGDVADLAADDGPDRVLLLEQRPGIGLDLLHAQRDALGLRVHVEDHRVHLIADGHHLGGMLHPLGPAHLADVNQALDAGLHLDEGAVVGERDHLAGDAGPGRELLRRVRPGVLLDLLEAQADALGGRVELEDDHPQLVADVEHLARVPDAAPAHVGDVQEPVDAAQVDERAVVGGGLDVAGEDGALLELLEGVLLQRLPLLLEQDAPAEHDVAALLVELDHLELELLADQLVQIADRTQIHLRAGEERLHADVDGEAALHAPDDGSLDELVALARGGDLVPDAHLVGLLLGEDDHARVVLARLEQHLDLVAGLDVGLAVDQAEFLDRHLAFALVADVDDRVVLGDLDDAALDDLVLLQLAFSAALAFEALLEHRGKVFVLIRCGLVLVIGGSAGGRIRHELGLTCDSGTSPP